MLLVFLFLYLPIFVLIVFSFNASKSRSVWSGFTLDWYKELFQNSMILDALWVTLAVSILAAVISTIIGTAAAIGFTNFRRRHQQHPPDQRGHHHRRVHDAVLCTGGQRL